MGVNGITIDSTRISSIVPTLPEIKEWAYRTTVNKLPPDKATAEFLQQLANTHTIANTVQFPSSIGSPPLMQYDPTHSAIAQVIQPEQGEQQPTTTRAVQRLNELTKQFGQHHMVQHLVDICKLQISNDKGSFQTIKMLLTSIRREKPEDYGLILESIYRAFPDEAITAIEEIQDPTLRRELGEYYDKFNYRLPHAELFPSNIFTTIPDGTLTTLLEQQEQLSNTWRRARKGRRRYNQQQSNTARALRAIKGIQQNPFTNPQLPIKEIDTFMESIGSLLQKQGEHHLTAQKREEYERIAWRLLGTYGNHIPPVLKTFIDNGGTGIGGYSSKKLKFPDELLATIALIPGIFTDNTSTIRSKEAPLALMIMRYTLYTISKQIPQAISKIHQTIGQPISQNEMLGLAKTAEKIRNDQLKNEIRKTLYPPSTPQPPIPYKRREELTREVSGVLTTYLEHFETSEAVKRAVKEGLSDLPDEQLKMVHYIIHMFAKPDGDELTIDEVKKLQTILPFYPEIKPIAQKLESYDPADKHRIAVLTLRYALQTISDNLGENANYMVPEITQEEIQELVSAYKQTHPYSSEILNGISKETRDRVIEKLDEYIKSIPNGYELDPKHTARIYRLIARDFGSIVIGQTKYDMKTILELQEDTLANLVRHEATFEQLTLLRMITNTDPIDLFRHFSESDLTTILGWYAIITTITNRRLMEKLLEENFKEHEQSSTPPLTAITDYLRYQEVRTDKLTGPINIPGSHTIRLARDSIRYQIKKFNPSLGMLTPFLLGMVGGGVMAGGGVIVNSAWSNSAHNKGFKPPIVQQLSHKAEQELIRRLPFKVDGEISITGDNPPGAIFKPFEAIAISGNLTPKQMTREQLAEISDYIVTLPISDLNEPIPIYDGSITGISLHRNPDELSATITSEGLTLNTEGNDTPTSVEIGYKTDPGVTDRIHKIEYLSTDPYNLTIDGNLVEESLRDLSNTPEIHALLEITYQRLLTISDPDVQSEIIMSSLEYLGHYIDTTKHYSLGVHDGSSLKAIEHQGFECDTASWIVYRYLKSLGLKGSITHGILNSVTDDGVLRHSSSHAINTAILPNGEVYRIDMTPPITAETDPKDIEALAYHPTMLSSILEQLQLQLRLSDKRSLEHIKSLASVILVADLLIQQYERKQKNNKVKTIANNANSRYDSNNGTEHSQQPKLGQLEREIMLNIALATAFTENTASLGELNLALSEVFKIREQSNPGLIKALITTVTNKQMFFGRTPTKTILEATILYNVLDNRMGFNELLLPQQKTALSNYIRSNKEVLAAVNMPFEDFLNDYVNNGGNNIPDFGIITGEMSHLITFMQSISPREQATRIALQLNKIMSGNIQFRPEAEQRLRDLANILKLSGDPIAFDSALVKYFNLD